MKILLEQVPLLWSDVANYEGLYKVSNSGIVVNVRYLTDKRMKDRIDRGGYTTVGLFKNGKVCTHFVHRLVAAAFLCNPEEKPEVNHLNGNKRDNRAINLEWATHAENMLHAHRSGLIARIESKQVIDTCTGRLFSSVREAADCYSIPYSTCKNYLNGNRKNPTCLRFLAQRLMAA